MKTTFKKTAVAALAVATLVSAGSITFTNDAEAGRRDFWAGAGAGFITGVIVNEATRHRHSPRYVQPRYSSWDAHVSWCYDRWNSYSHHTDTYITFSGRHKRCRSPYL